MHSGEKVTVILLLVLGHIDRVYLACMVILKALFYLLVCSSNYIVAS